MKLLFTKKTLSLFFILMATTCVASAESYKTNTTGIDERNFNTQVSACRDFYEHANGKWLRRNPIPPEYSSWNVFMEIFERNNDIIKGILEDVSTRENVKDGSIEQKVGTLYNVGMDEEKIENVGLTPLEPLLYEIQNISSPQDVANMIMTLHKQGLKFVFDVYADPDFKKSSQIIAYMDQDGLGLPDRDYYTKNDADSRKLRAQYLQHLQIVFKLLNDSAATASKKAKAVLDLETKLANASQTKIERRDPKNRYNLVSLNEANGITSNFDWNKYAETVGLKAKKFSMTPTSFFESMDKQIQETPAQDWQAYFQWHLIKNNSRYLPEKFETAHFNFYNKTVYGQKKMLPRWKRVKGTIDNYLGEALGKLYVEQQFPPKAKKAAMTMIKDLQAALKIRLKNLEWMQKETKKQALKKLATFDPKIGHPDKWENYKDLEITNDSYVANVLRAREFEFKDMLSDVGKAPDRNKWYMNAHDVNAYYNPLQNEIVFPAGILQPPFFDANIDKPVNYGAIGGVIGHEIMHGFDDEGSKFDAKGNYNNWWTEEDRKEFEKRVEILVKQYNQFSPLPGYRVNGKLTLGENIGDLGGLSLAYEALRDDFEKNNEVIDGLTPEQRFFHAWAQGWRYKTTIQNRKIRLRTDPHSPGKFRVNGVVQNMPEFQEAFSCNDRDQMVLPKGKRAEIW